MTAGLRIADVTQWYSPTSGGIRTYLHAKADYAARTGTPHAIVVTGRRAGLGRIADSRVVIVRGRTATSRWGYRMAMRARGVLAALEDIGPSVVVIHDALAFPGAISRWAEPRGVAVVMVCHSQLTGATAGLPRPVRTIAAPALERVQARSLRAGELILVASEQARRQVAPTVRVPVVVSPLGVDIDGFAGAAPSPSLRRRLAGSEQALLVYAGRLSSEKRVTMLADVLAALPERYVLAIAGTGTARAQLEHRARRRGVRARMRFLGHISDRCELAALLATADCFVHPNPDEPFGLAPVEALTAGCRVVLPRTAGAAPLIAEYGGVSVAPGDPHALAAGVIAAMSGPRPAADLVEHAWDRTFGREWHIYARLSR